MPRPGEVGVSLGWIGFLQGLAIRHIFVRHMHERRGPLVLIARFDRSKRLFDVRRVEPDHGIHARLRTFNGFHFDFFNRSFLPLLRQRQRRNENRGSEKNYAQQKISRTSLNDLHFAGP